MSIYKIEKNIKDYLISKNVDFVAKCKEDECSLNIKKIGDFYYVKSHASYYQGIVNFHGLPASGYIKSPSYMLVCDENGNIIIDLTEISDLAYNFNDIKSLDDKNIILPIINKETGLNNYQHYKIDNGKFTLVNTFDEAPDSYDSLLKDKLVTFGGKLYNFEKNIILGNEFDKIFTVYNYGINSLADYWKIPSKQNEEFVDTISKKMKENSLVGGFKKVEVKKDGFRNEFDTFIFIDKNGNYVSELYYLDDNNFISIYNVTPDNYEFIIQQLKNRLVSKIDAIKMEQEKKKEIISQLIKRLSL